MIASRTVSRGALALALASSASLAACSSSGVTLEVALDLPAKASLGPYESGRVAFVRVGVDGTERLDEVFQDLDLTARSATFEEYPIERSVRVVVSGIDELGNTVAYGEADAAIGTDDVSVSVPFRRALAYVIHRDICDGGCADGQICADPGDGHRCLPVLPETDCIPVTGCAIEAEVCVRVGTVLSCEPPYAGGGLGTSKVYAIDVSSKVLVDVITLPIPTAIPLSITNKGGEGVWVTLQDGAESKATFLSSSTHQWSAPIGLHPGAEFAIGAPGQAYLVAAGGGQLAVHDAASGAEVRKVPVGGRVLDGVIGGALRDKALIVTSDTLAKLDLEAPETAIALNPGELVGASGAALSPDGRFVYVTSRANGQLIAFDMISGGSALLGTGFASPVRELVFSERAQMVLGILASDPSVFVGAFSLIDKSSFPAAEAIGTLPEAGGMASVAGGTRVIVVSAGTSTGSAGFTVVDPIPSETPTGSTVTYLRDPTDTYTQGGNQFRQRYRPHKVAGLYGQ